MVNKMLIFLKMFCNDIEEIIINNQEFYKNLECKLN
jgi:hypothetical protein